MTVRICCISIVLACIAQASPPTASMTGYVEWEDGALKLVDLLPLYPNGIPLTPSANGEIPFTFSTGKGSTRVVGIRLALKDDADSAYVAVIVAPSEAESQTTSGKWVGARSATNYGLIIDTEGGLWLARRWPVLRSAGISVAGISSLHPGTAASQPTSAPASNMTTREYAGAFLSADSSLALCVKFPSSGDDRRVRVAATGDWSEKQAIVRCDKPGGGNPSTALTRRGYFVLANYAGTGSVNVEAVTSPDAAAADQSDWVRFVGTTAEVK